MSAPTLADRKKAIEEVKPCARMEDVAWLAAVVFLLLGIVSDVIDKPLGLEATSWFLLVIGAMLAAVFFRLGRAVYWYLITTK